MGLLDQAAADVHSILTDTEGFGTTVTVKSPEGVSAQIVGIGAFIGQVIDLDTNQAVAGESAHVTLPTTDLIAAFGKLPKGVHDENLAAWTITMQLPAMPAAQSFKVLTTLPDRIGAIVCVLEYYRA